MMRKNWIVLGVFLGGIVASLDVLRSVISHQGFMSYTGVLFSLFVAFSVYGGILAILGMVLHSLFLKNEQRGQIVFLWLMLVLAISNSFSPMLSIFPRLSITEKSAFIVVYCMFVMCRDHHTLYIHNTLRGSWVRMPFLRLAAHQMTFSQKIVKPSFTTPT